MSTQDIAGIVSQSTPESGQNNRSSANFQFLAVPSSGSITVAMQGATSAVLMYDRGGNTDVTVSGISPGSTFDASKVSTGDYNYYIASPQGASSNFAVYFSGNVDF